jgi:hypothetical protein
MSDKQVRVPFGDSAADTATLLLEAVEKKDQDPSVVTTSSYGGFLVPEEIAKAAGVDYEDPAEAQGHLYSEKQVKAAAKEPVAMGDQDPAPEGDEADKPRRAARKAPAKKATSKKDGD